MALRELLAEPPLNYNVVKATTFHAGCALGFNLLGTTTDDKLKVVPANRATLGAGVTAASSWVGFAADDHAVTGNTMILPDPVGATFISTTDNSVFLGEANGWYLCDKRVITDFQDESIVNISNLTESYPANPKRGVGVFAKPGGSFITDQFVETYTTAATTDHAVVFDVAFNVGDPLTYGAGTNAGKLVRLADATHGVEVARVDKVENSGTTGAMLYFVQLAA